MLFSDPTLQELSWRSVAKSRMLPLSVVKNLDVFKGDSLDLSVRSIPKAMHPLVLKLLNQLSVGALSQQFPVRLIEQVMPYALSLS